jgi:hypothetical protein
VGHAAYAPSPPHINQSRTSSCVVAPKGLASAMNLLDHSLCVAHCLHVGMAFQSGVAAEGSGPHLTLTYAVAIVLVASVCTFFVMLGREIYRSAKFAHRARTSRRRAWNLKSSANSDATSGPRGAATGTSGHPDGAASGPGLSLRGLPQSVWRTNPLRAGKSSLALASLQQDWASSSSADAGSASDDITSRGSGTQVAQARAAPSDNATTGSQQRERDPPSRAARAALARGAQQPGSAQLEVGAHPASSQSSPQATGELATPQFSPASRRQSRPPPPPPRPPIVAAQRAMPGEPRQRF